MKKIVLLCLWVGSIHAHDFLTEILVYSSEYGYNPYHVAVSYELTEQNLSQAVSASRTRYEVNKLTKRSTSRNKQAEYRRVGSTDCDFENDVFEKTCGVFDHFNAARVVATDRCNAYATAHLFEYPVGLIPQFTGPGSFTDGTSAAVDHHTNYHFSDGLSFNCVALVTSKPPYAIEGK